MHEMALAEGIVGVVEGALKERGEENLRVERINLRVGKLNAVVLIVGQHHAAIHRGQPAGHYRITVLLFAESCRN